MEVTRHNFDTILPHIKQALDECTFFSFDCEMTGLFLGDRNQGSFFDDIEERYEETLASSNAFVINQFGLSIFIPSPNITSTSLNTTTTTAINTNEQQNWQVKTFNIYVFPRPTSESGINSEVRFTSQATSLDFLARCHFDFNKWIHDGVSYTALSSRDYRLSGIEREYNNNNNNNNNNSGGSTSNNSSTYRERAEIVPTKEEDIIFVADTIFSIKQWLQDPTIDSWKEPLYLKSANSYQRALQYQELRRREQFTSELLLLGSNGYGMSGDANNVEERGELYAERDTDPETNKPRLVISLMTTSQIEQRKLEERQAKERIINQAAGFSTVFELLRDSQKPAVGHNLGFDLAYSLHSFVKPLPASWLEYKQLIAMWFPGGVYDTKYLASKLLNEKYIMMKKAGGGGGHMNDDATTRAASGLVIKLLQDTSLGSLYNSLTKGEDLFAQSFSNQLTLDSSLPTGTDGSTMLVDGNTIHNLNLNIQHAPGYNRYKDVDAVEAFAHEAGFDAYMTGAVFLHLCGLYHRHTLSPSQQQEDDITIMPMEEDNNNNNIKREQQPGPSITTTTTTTTTCRSYLQAVEPYVNRMNISRSDMEYVALVGPDPPLYRPQVLHVTNFAGIPSLTTATTTATATTTTTTTTNDDDDEQQQQQPYLPRNAELSRRLGEKLNQQRDQSTTTTPSAYVRVTSVSTGLLVDVGDEGSVDMAAQWIRTMYPGCEVQEYAVYAELKRQAREEATAIAAAGTSGTVQAGAGYGSGGGGGGGGTGRPLRKRQRTDDNNNGDGGSDNDEKKASWCPIM
jgi:poly(A)-specific ribonuclease